MILKMNNESVRFYLKIVQPKAEINFNIRRRHLQAIIPYDIGIRKEKKFFDALKSGISTPTNEL